MKEVFYTVQVGLSYNIMRRFEDGDVILIGTVFHKRNADEIQGLLNEDYRAHKREKKFYFTMGCRSEWMPYKKGWVTVYAKSREEAQEIYNKKFGLTEYGSARYSFMYNEEQFRATIMYKEGNFGAFSCETLQSDEEFSTNEEQIQERLAKLENLVNNTEDISYLYETTVDIHIAGVTFQVPFDACIYNEILTSLKNYVKRSKWNK